MEHGLSSKFSNDFNSSLKTNSQKKYRDSIVFSPDKDALYMRDTES